MSALALNLRDTAGYLVADARGRIVGRVECPMYGTSPEQPDALAVRSGFLPVVAVSFPPTRSSRSTAAPA